MKIKANKFKEILNKTILNGKIEDLKLDFIKEGLKLSHVDSAMVGLSYGFITAANFDDYSEMEVKLPSSQKLLNIVGAFGDSIIELVNGDETFILRNAAETLVLGKCVEVTCEFPNEFLSLKNDVITVEVFKNSLDKISKMASIFKINEVLFSVKEEIMTISVKNEVDKYELKVSAADCPNGDAIISVEYLMDVVNPYDKVKISYTFNDEKDPAGFAVIIEAGDFKYAIAKISMDEE